jgi:hypothetical protein
MVAKSGEKRRHESNEGPRRPGEETTPFRRVAGAPGHQRQRSMASSSNAVKPDHHGWLTKQSESRMGRLLLERDEVQSCVCSQATG